MKKISLSDISQELKEAISALKASDKLEEIGVVTKVGDGVAWVYGLTRCGFNELVQIEIGSGKIIPAFALNIEEEQVGVVMLGDEKLVRAGAQVRLTGQIFSIPVGEALLGRVVDPLGRPLDGLGEIVTTEMSMLEKIAPGVMERQSVTQPIMTGIKAIDAVVPIGKGQRELIIGDRQTGKTSIAVDTILNQHKQNTGVVCIYVAVGQKKSKVARIVDRLKKEGAFTSVIVVVTSAEDSAAMQFIAPYAGCCMGEYFRDKGQDALIVYDDLSKHAWAYRQMSLLLKRPPGREAYPGDVFYLHSRLLERAAKLSEAKGGGSLTALPIIETQGGDVSAYIPTNVISITDGQIYLESDLFYQGVRPAINVGLSVSRVGGSAQTKAMKSVAGKLRLELAQFRELAAFSQLATDLDADTKQRIERGKRLVELLKQPEFSPLPLPYQVVALLAGTNGIFDDIPVEKTQSAAEAIINSAQREQSKTLKAIVETGIMTDEQKTQLLALSKSVVQQFKEKAK